jgi:DNA-binding transcriptional LysR family regulator
MSIDNLIKNIDWDKLRTFYYVAKAGGFTQASSYLNLAQSTISRTIQNLEAELGFPIFVRHRNGIILTKEGDILFKTATNIFAEIKQALDEIEAEREEPQGTLRLTISSGALHHFILPHIPEFLRRFPKINLTLVATHVTPILDLLEADAAIRPKIEGRDDLFQKHLMTNHVQLFASEDYLREFGIPREPKELDNHRLIAFGDHKEAISYQAMNWHLTLGKPQGEIRIPYIQANSPQVRLNLAEAGIGIVAISAEHPGLSDMNLIQILQDIPGPTVETYYIYAKAHENSKKLKVFEDYLMGIFKRTI